MNTKLQMSSLLLLHCVFLLTNSDCNSRAAGADKTCKNVSVGGHVTLPCINWIKRTDCRNTSWIFDDSSVSLELVTVGNINPSDSGREKRISLTSNCSLNISDIRAEDCGSYYCQQWVKNKKVADDVRLCLFVTADNDRDGIDMEVVIPSVLIVIVLSVAILIVWLRYRRRAHERTSLVNQNDAFNDHHGEDLTYTELNHITVKPMEVYMRHQETVYSTIKP